MTLVVECVGFCPPKHATGSNENKTLSAPCNRAKNGSSNIQEFTYEGKFEQAVFIFDDSHGFMTDKTVILKSKGLTDTEILEALSIAISGEFLRAVGID